MPDPSQPDQPVPSTPSSGETVLFQGSPSVLVHFGTLTICAIVAIAGIALAVAVSLIFLVLTAAALVYAGIQWILIKSLGYEVTTERIRMSSGILTRRTDELELYRVKDATLIEPLALRVFGLSTIEITTADSSTPFLHIRAIRGGKEVREHLRKSIEVCRDKKRVRLAELD